MLDTNACTPVSLMVWLFLDMFATKKLNAVSMINGMIVGLVALTPAAGYVDGAGAMLIGLVAGTIAWVSLNRVGNLTILDRVDDTFGAAHARRGGARRWADGRRCGESEDDRVSQR